MTPAIDLKAPAKRAFYNVITVAALGVLLVVVIFLLAKVRELSTDIRRSQLSATENADKRNDLIVGYLRCIALIVPEERTPENIQTCVDTGRLPDGSTIPRPTPTSDQRSDRSSSGQSAATSSTPDPVPQPTPVSPAPPAPTTSPPATREVCDVSLSLLGVETKTNCRQEPV